MTSGVGRGRGWLNIKPADKKPGGTVTTEINPQESNKYNGIINLFKQINQTDDGIHLNRKLNEIYKIMGQECKENEEVRACVNSIFQQTLKDRLLANNFALSMHLHPFTKPLYKDTLKMFLIQHLQVTFENAEKLHSSKPNEFRNFVRLLCVFYGRYEARPMIFAMPILHCFELLLLSSSPEDCEELAVSLNLVITHLNFYIARELDNFLLKIRTLLIKNNYPTNICRTWLLLALDVDRFKETCIPSSLINFYKDYLGEKALYQITTPFATEDQQIIAQTNKPTESNDKGINDLQNSMENKVHIIENNTPTYTKQPPIHYEALYKQGMTKQSAKNDGVPNKVSQSPDSGRSQPKSQQNDQQYFKEKAGRPILGVGARLNKKK